MPAAEFSRLDRVYQYALAIAAQADDYTQRQLGPIHLLKYAYLADLAHAERHEGATFSGVEWRFYHFGPWSEQALSRVAPAVESIHAEVLKLPSRYADDFTRFKLRPDEADRLVGRLEDDLPSEVARSVRSAVREHGSDTADLLRRVYLTRPMLHARPDALLDFSLVATPRLETAVVEAPPVHELSRKERTRRAEHIADIRREIARRFHAIAAKARAASPNPAPRYDEVFFQGTAQLDQLAGEPISPSEGEVEFDDSVWLSDQRREPDVS